MVKTCTLVISGEIYHFKFILDFLLYFFAYCRRYYSIATVIIACILYVVKNAHCLTLA